MDKKQKKEFLDIFTEAFHEAIVPSLEANNEVLRGEMKSMKDELKGEIRSMKDELKGEIRENRKSIRRVEQSVLSIEERFDEKDGRHENLEKRVRVLENRILVN